MRAAGCMTLMCLRMVAPSLVMTTSPCAVWIILSIPRGPSEVRTASATAASRAWMSCEALWELEGRGKGVPLAAVMLLSLTSIGFSLPCRAAAAEGQPGQRVELEMRRRRRTRLERAPGGGCGCCLRCCYCWTRHLCARLVKEWWRRRNEGSLSTRLSRQLLSL